MYKYVNKENLCSVDFSLEQNPVSQVAPPSLSELINEARQTGQMPYGNQRKPLPSYTESFDNEQYFDGRDKIDGQVNAISFASSITAKENELKQHKWKLAEAKKSITTTTQPAPVNE